MKKWKQVNALFFRQADFVQFLLEQRTGFLYFLTDVVLVSYKPVSYKKTCINSYKIRADKRLWNLDISRLKRAVFSIFSYGVTA